MIEYQEIPVTDLSQIKVGDMIEFWYSPRGTCNGTVTEICIDVPDHRFGINEGYYPDVRLMSNIRKLIKIEQPNYQTMNTPIYSPELLQVIKSKNAWVIAAVTQNGQLDFTVSQSMEQSEPAAKDKIEQLSKQHPGVIFTTFKLQHAVRQQPAQIVVK